MIPVRLSVPANTPWIDSGVDVEAGESLDISATGAWRDAWIDCGPDGHDAAHLRPFAGLKRCRTGQWLELVACVAQDLRSARPIGAGRTLVAPRKGRLYLFANDARGMYWNNAGAIEVEIRLPSASDDQIGTAWEPPSATSANVSMMMASAAAMWAAAALGQGAPSAAQPLPGSLSELIETPSPEADPFDQFDLGMAVVRPGSGVSEWLTGAEAGLNLLPETVFPTVGDTVDQLLLVHRIRPDDYSRELIGVLNPGLGDSLTVMPGEPLTLPRVEGLPDGALLAIQPYRSERLRIEELREAINEQTQALRPHLAPTDFARVASATERLFEADELALRTRPDQLLLSATALEQHQSLLASDASLTASMVFASAQAATAAVAAPGDRHRSARWRISVTGPGEAVAGYCRLVWAVAGFTGHPGSVESEALPMSAPLRVPPANVEAWVERQGREISPRLVARRLQLLAEDVRHDTLVRTGRCDR